MADYITIDPSVHFGKPCIAGTRIPVRDVLELLKQGLTFDEILRDYYPELQKEHLQACLQFAIDLLGAEEIHVSAPAA